MTDANVLTREQVLALLSKKAREGSVSAAIALERALRIDPHEQDDFEDQLDRLPGEGRAPEDLRPASWTALTPRRDAN